MHVLLIRSDLPESPEVLLLSGLLSDRAAGWVPSPEAITCKLVKLWAWVAEHGARDSDSLDYLVPSKLIEPLEMQLGCAGLVAAMADPSVHWSEGRGQLVAFCRFAEWNGPEALKRRGDSARAKRSRERSKGRILRAEPLGGERKTPPKTSAKAHANCDARHVSSDSEQDVDVDVHKPIGLKTSTSTATPAEPPEPAPLDPPIAADPRAIFATIRAAFRSPHDADAAAVAGDRELAWKVAVVVAELLGLAWIERVIAAAAKATPRRPYAYLWAAVERGLKERHHEAPKRLFAAITAPPDLEQWDTGPARMEPPRPRVESFETIRDKELRAVRADLIRRGVRGDELVAALDDFDKQLTERLKGKAIEHATH